MPNTPPPEKSNQAAIALLKLLQQAVNSTAFTDFHAIVAENEKLRTEKERFDATQEENCILLTRKQNELNDQKEKALKREADLVAARKGTDSVRKELATSKEKEARLKKERESTSSKISVLMMKIKKGEEEAAKWERKATEHENLRVKADAAALKAEQELKATKKDLSTAKSRLEELERYSYHFKEPEWAEITRSLQSLFCEAYSFINAYFNVDFDQQILTTPVAWNQLVKHESILRALPLPRSNSAPAKLMRVAAVLCVLATALTESLFQPTYLLEESNELAEMLDDLLQTDPAQERHLRAQMLGFDPEQQQRNSYVRVEAVVVDVFNFVSDLLLPAQKPAFRDGLEALCKSALGTWVQVQRLGLRVEPTLEAGRGDLWRLLPAAPPTSAAAAPPRAALPDIKLVVWPAFLVAKPAGAAVLSDGFAVAQGQTQLAAREEVAEAVPERHRSARRRPRANTNGALAPSKPFLPSDSGKQSNGG